MPDVPLSRAPWWAFALIGVALVGFIAVAVISFLNFNKEPSLRAVPYSTGSPGSPHLKDGVQIDSRTLMVDTSLNEVTYRLVFTPLGSYAAPSGQLNRPVTVDVPTDNGTVTKEFKAGQEMRSQDVKEVLDNGFQSDYPFDHYETGVTVGVFNPADETVPMELNVQAEVHGFSFSLVDSNRQADGYFAVDFGVRRSGATR